MTGSGNRAGVCFVLDVFCCLLYILKANLRDVAQLVARLVWDQNVAGSNPVIPICNSLQCSEFFLYRQM